MIKCLFGCHAWHIMWIRVDDAVKAGLPKEAVGDLHGRILIKVCYRCGKLNLAKGERIMEKLSCSGCGRDMLYHAASKGMPAHYVCPGCSATKPVAPATTSEGHKGSGKRTLVD